LQDITQGYGSNLDAIIQEKPLDEMKVQNIEDE